MSTFTFMFGFNPADREGKRKRVIKNATQNISPPENEAEDTHRERRGCRRWERTVALWSAGQGGLESGNDQEKDPGGIWLLRGAGPDGKEGAAVAVVSSAALVPADAGAVGSVAACY